MNDNLFSSTNLFVNQHELIDNDEGVETPDGSEGIKPKTNWEADPLAAWKANEASTIKRLYLNDPLVREGIDLQMAREKRPAIQTTPPKDEIIGLTEDGKLYARRTARTDADRMEMMAAIRKSYDG